MPFWDNPETELAVRLESQLRPRRNGEKHLLPKAWQAMQPAARCQEGAGQDPSRARGGAGAKPILRSQVRERGTTAGRDRVPRSGNCVGNRFRGNANGGAGGTARHVEPAPSQSSQAKDIIDHRPFGAWTVNLAPNRKASISPECPHALSRGDLGVLRSSDFGPRNEESRHG